MLTTLEHAAETCRSMTCAMPDDGLGRCLLEHAAEASRSMTHGAQDVADP